MARSSYLFIYSPLLLELPFLYMKELVAVLTSLTESFHQPDLPSYRAYDQTERSSGQQQSKVDVVRLGYSDQQVSNHAEDHRHKVLTRRLFHVIEESIGSIIGGVTTPNRTI